MPITVRCTSAACGKPCRVKETLAGKVVKCPTCGERIKVPLPAAATANAETRPKIPAAADEVVPPYEEMQPAPIPQLVPSGGLLDVVLISKAWRGTSKRAVPLLTSKVLSIDRILVLWASIVAFAVGTLMVTGILPVYRSGEDREVGMRLVLLPVPAYAIALLFHRFVRHANRYYVPLALIYLPAAAAVYLMFLGAMVDLVLGPVRPLDPPRNAGLGVFIACILVGYVLTLAIAMFLCVRSDMRTRHLPPGSFSFAFGAVFVIVSVPIGLFAFAQFLSASPQADYLTDFVKVGALACAFSVPGIILSQREARLRKAAAEAYPRAAFLQNSLPLLASQTPVSQSSAAFQTPPTSAAVQGTPPIRFSMRGLLIACVIVELLLVLLGVNQLRSGTLGPAEIVRTNELTFAGSNMKFTPRAEDECILWFYLQGYTGQDLQANRNSLHMEVPTGEGPSDTGRTRMTFPLHELLNQSVTPVGSIDRVYFAFSIPRSATFPNLKIKQNRSISFRLPSEIVPRYEIEASGVFSWLWLAILFPLLAAAGYGVWRLMATIKRGDSSEAATVPSDA